jgi:hypothetical protein
MRIKMTTLMAGPEGVFQPGAERELPTPQAQRLIQAGAAVAMDPEPTPTRVKATAPPRETAAVSPPETPEEPTAKPKA